MGHPATDLAADERVSSKLSQAWLNTLRSCFNTFPQGNFDDVLATVAALHKAGVDILTGTDVSAPISHLGGLAHGASVHHELQLLVAAGLTTIELLLPLPHAVSDSPTEAVSSLEPALICCWSMVTPSRTSPIRSLSAPYGVAVSDSPSIDTMNPLSAPSTFQWLVVQKAHTCFSGARNICTTCPGRSRPRPPCGVDGVTYREVSRKPRMPMGRLIRKMLRHPNALTQA